MKWVVIDSVGYGRPCMIVAGLNLSHDSSFAIVQNGIVTHALALERTSRVKRGTVPYNVFSSEMGKLVKQVLHSADLTIDKIDYWVASSTETKSLEEEAELASLLSLIPEDRKLILPHPGHHLSHISSAFYSSGFDKAAGLVIDAYGSRIGDEREQETAFLCSVDDGIIRQFNTRKRSNRIAGKLINGEVRLPAELSGIGEIYRVITLALGFYENGTSYDDAGKTMGLAPYGQRFSEEPLFLRIKNGEIDFSKAMESLEALKLIEFTNEGARLLPMGHGKGVVTKKDLAAQIQKEFEEICLYLVQKVLDETEENNFVASGGCFLNSVLNGRLINETSMKNLFVFPAATDDGNAVGAALFAYYNLLPDKKTYKLDQIKDVYWGPDRLMDFDPVSLSSNWNLPFKDHGSLQKAAVAAAKYISDGELIGWFQSRSEFGPRALGARSILCHPGKPGMKDKLNARIKFREGFRPFAASCLEHDAKDWFDSPVETSPFMLIVCKAKKSKRTQINEVVHVDGTCRIQTVSDKNQNGYYDLIKEFNSLTGIPLVLNTSFNLRGMPIVEKPSEALDCLFGSRLHRIYIGQYEFQAPDFYTLTPMLNNLFDQSKNTLSKIEHDILAKVDGHNTTNQICELLGNKEEILDKLLNLRRLEVIDWIETPKRPLRTFLRPQYQQSSHF